MNTQYNNPVAAQLHARAVDGYCHQPDAVSCFRRKKASTISLLKPKMEYLTGMKISHFMNNETYDQYDVNRALYETRHLATRWICS